MTDPMTDPTTPLTEARDALAKAWSDLEADALASDGPIRDRDVRDAIKRNRARIEAAVLATIDPRVIAIGQAWLARGEPEYEYDGPVYVRPVGRGIHLSEAPGKPYIDDVVDEGDYVMQVRIWPGATALTDQERGS